MRKEKREGERMRWVLCCVPLLREASEKALLRRTKAQEQP